jgi:hypothetical protein
MWPDSINTGVLTFDMPTLDADILNEEAARAIEDHVRERFEERGYILVRIGKPPKRAIPFRAAMGPFKTFKVSLTAQNGSEGEKIEFLANGAQIVVNGTHPETGQPYRWFGGELDQILREQLPDIREDEAHALVDELVEILRDFGYKPATKGQWRRSAEGTRWRWRRRSRLGSADGKHPHRPRASRQCHHLRRQADRQRHEFRRGGELPARADGQVHRAQRRPLAHACERNPGRRRQRGREVQQAPRALVCRAQTRALTNGTRIPPPARDPQHVPQMAG